MTPYGPTWRVGARRTRRRAPGAVPPTPISTCGDRCGDRRAPRPLARRLGCPRAPGWRRLLHDGARPRLGRARRRRADAGGEARRRGALARACPRRVGARRRPRVAAGPAGLRAGPAPVRTGFGRGTGPPRSALHHAVAVTGSLRRDDP